MSHVSESPEIAAQPAEGLYLPLPVALAVGRLDMEALDPHSPQFASLMVRNGMIPDQAGTLELPGDGLAAFDLVDGVFSDDGLHILPTSKMAVDTESRRVQGGKLIVLTFADEDRVRPVADVAPSVKASWNRSFKRMGQCAVRLLGMDAPFYDIRELCDDGGIKAALPKRYF